MSSQVVVVLGMHRSYTSLIAEWLHANGVSMHDNAQPAPLYSEDPRFLDLQNRFLESQHMNWLNAHAPFADRDGKYRQQALDLVEGSQRAGHAWGWKDPRTCILYDFLWRDALARPKFLAVYRDPHEVVESLLMRKMLKRTIYRYLPDWFYLWHLRRHRKMYDEPHLVCWNYYNRQLLNVIRNAPEGDAILVDGSNLISLDDQLRNAIRAQWGLNLNGPTLGSLAHASTLTERASFAALDDDVVRESGNLLNELDAARSFKELVNVSSS